MSVKAHKVSFCQQDVKDIATFLYGFVEKVDASDISRAAIGERGEQLACAVLTSFGFSVHYLPWGTRNKLNFDLLIANNIADVILSRFDLATMARVG